MHLRKKVHPTILNNDKRVSLYMVDVDADGFRLILRINVVEDPIKESLNLSPPPPKRLAVDDYLNDENHSINMEDDFMHMEYVSSDSQDMEEDCGAEPQSRNSFAKGINFYRDQTLADNKELKMLLDGASMVVAGKKVRILKQILHIQVCWVPHVRC